MTETDDPIAESIRIHKKGCSAHLRGVPCKCPVIKTEKVPFQPGLPRFQPGLPPLPPKVKRPKQVQNPRWNWDGYTRLRDDVYAELLRSSEAAGERDKAEAALRQMTVDRDKWRIRAEIAEAKLASVGIK